MVKAGHISHDSSFIGLGSIDDICENQDVRTEDKPKSAGTIVKFISVSEILNIKL